MRIKSAWVVKTIIKSILEMVCDIFCVIDINFTLGCPSEES